MERTTKLTFLFATVYFVQGIGSPDSGIAGQPVLYLLKEHIGLTAAQTAYFLTIMALPWNVKPLSGLLSDFLPLWGYRRKSYLVLVNTAMVLCWLSLVFAPAYTYGFLLSALTACALGFAFSDVLCDALMVETGKPIGMTGRFQSVQWMGLNLAAVIAGIGGGYIAQHLSYATIFCIAGAFPLMTVAMTLLVVREKRSRVDREQARRTFTSLKQLVKLRNLWIVIGFLFLWNFSPSFGAPLFYYMRDTLGFSKIFIGSIESVESVGRIVGAGFFWYFCRRLPLRKLINVSIGIGVVAALGYLGLIGHRTAVFLQFSIGMISMVAHLTMLDLAARNCPDWVEGTAFALLMSVFNIANNGSRALGGWLYDQIGLQWLIVISAAFTALCWTVVPYLRLEGGARRERLEAVPPVSAAGGSDAGEDV